MWQKNDIVISISLLLLAVMFVGKGGYWEGCAGGQEGWFPCAAIREVASEPQNLPPPELEPDYPTATQQVPIGSSAQAAQYTQPFRSGRTSFGWHIH